MKVAPSMLSADFNHLLKDIQEIEEAGAEYLHLDVMDGHFVPNISYGPMIFQGLRQHSKMVFDCHMMVADPERYIKSAAEAGADIITVHIETTQHIYSTLQQIHNAGKKAGIAINPGTPVEAILSVLDMVDLVLVMSVNPGFGGQTFISAVLSKIKQLADLRQAGHYDFEIEVDGGINPETGAACLAAGADILVAGSYIFNETDRAKAIDSLRQPANN